MDIRSFSLGTHCTAFGLGAEGRPGIAKNACYLSPAPLRRIDARGLRVPKPENPEKPKPKKRPWLHWTNDAPCGPPLRPGYPAGCILPDKAATQGLTPLAIDVRPLGAAVREPGADARPILYL